MGRLYALLAGALAFVGAIGAVFFKGGQSQRRKDKIKAQKGKITALETEREIDQIDDDDVLGRLRDKWLRPDGDK